MVNERLMILKLKESFFEFFTKLKSPVFKNILLVGGLVLLVKIVSFYKETLISSSFGLSELLDTYLIAVLIPSFLQVVFIGALKNLFIPNYIIEMKTSNQLSDFQLVIFILLTIFSCFLIFIVYMFTDILLEQLYPGHDIAFYAMIRRQLYIILPCLFLWGYSSFLSGLLEINNKFFISTIAMFIGPTTTILCIILFNDFFGDMTLAWSLTLGSILGFTYLFISAHGYNVLNFGKFRLNENIRMMLRQYPPKITSGLLSGINPFVDQFFAAQLAIGSIAAMNYGIRIPAFMVSIIMIALGNVILPYFSKMVNVNLDATFKVLFKTAKYVFTICLCIVLIAMYFSDDIIRIVFERGKFQSEDTEIVSLIMKIALAYVPFYLCTLLCVKFLTATNKNTFMAWVSLWNFGLNLLLNLVLVKIYGIYGLVLSTTFVYITCSIIYMSYTYKFYQKKRVQKT